MATAKVNLESLNKVLPNRTANKNTKRRYVSDHHRNDVVSDELSKCNTAAEIGNLGMKFGLSEKRGLKVKNCMYEYETEIIRERNRKIFVSKCY